MEYQEHYDNMEERNIHCKTAELIRFRMLHDDFDEDWEVGDEPHGTLTFTDEPAPQAEPVMALATKISELEARVEILEGS